MDSSQYDGRLPSFSIDDDRQDNSPVIATQWNTYENWGGQAEKIETSTPEQHARNSKKNRVV